MWDKTCLSLLITLVNSLSSMSSTSWFTVGRIADRVGVEYIVGEMLLVVLYCIWWVSKAPPCRPDAGTCERWRARGRATSGCARRRSRHRSSTSTIGPDCPGCRRFWRRWRWRRHLGWTVVSATAECLDSRRYTSRCSYLHSVRTTITRSIVIYVATINATVIIHRLKWCHSTPWSRYDLHIVGHDVELDEVNW